MQYESFESVARRVAVNGAIVVVGEVEEVEMEQTLGAVNRAGGVVVVAVSEEEIEEAFDEVFDAVVGRETVVVLGRAVLAPAVGRCMYLGRGDVVILQRELPHLQRDTHQLHRESPHRESPPAHNDLHNHPHPDAHHLHQQNHPYTAVIPNSLTSYILTKWNTT